MPHLSRKEKFDLGRLKFPAKSVDKIEIKVKRAAKALRSKKLLRGGEMVS